MFQPFANLEISHQQEEMLFGLNKLKENYKLTWKELKIFWEVIGKVQMKEVHYKKQLKLLKSI